ncbi:Hypp9351 [Branchiostoma lanceolatum]|uniref:Hypp9351 protein n=1 Tax=Branchiostoma lanceolatum TaxID=7740 RepID=A0A8S4MLC6_BRALA|nr:Hypp9351 [Branchiostoma lanceolatum]
MKSETVTSTLLMKIERSTDYQYRGALEVHDDKEAAFSAVYSPSRNDGGGDLHYLNCCVPPHMRKNMSCGSGDSRCPQTPEEGTPRSRQHGATRLTACGRQLTTHGW